MRKIYWMGAVGIGIIVTVLAAWITLGFAWLNVPGLVLVIGGTLLASVIGHSASHVIDLLRRLPALFREGQEPLAVDFRPFLRMADLHWWGDVRRAEQAAIGIRDPFLHSAAKLALDRHSRDELHRVMHWGMRQQKDRDSRDIRILRTMGTFAPAFGMLGTLLGLIALLGDLGQSGMEYIGVAMGFALMSTLYGLLAATLVFRPLALKLEDRSRQRLLQMSIMLDAVIMLYERQHPVAIREYIQSVYPDSVGDPAPGAPVAATAAAAPVSLQRLRA